MPRQETNARLLREEFDALGIDALVVPREDEHLGREVPPHAERLAWLTGFTGSAGLSIVSRDRATLFVDGRYVVQAQREVDLAEFEIAHLTRSPPSHWITQHLRKGDRLGCTPRLHSITDVQRFEEAVAKAGGSLVSLDESPIDRLWGDRPSPAPAAIMIHDVAYAGVGPREKAQRVAEIIRENGLDASVLNALESVAWLFNVRGSDLASTPVVRSNAIIRSDGSAELFVSADSVTPELLGHLGNHVVVRPEEQFAAALADLGAQQAQVSIDPLNTNAWILQTLERAGAEVRLVPDPCVLPRACKNEVEVAGARAAHVRDGCALTGFIRWVKEEALRGNLSEIDAQEELYRRRSAGQNFRGSSFPSISAGGPNAAVVHYRASKATMLDLGSNPLYLIDSGGQYLEGTTDVTRTIAVGTPTAEMRRNFTLVLKGHIALARVRFPLGTTGEQLNVLARQYLWRDGLDFDHGTGHGVGSYLCVHEGPQRFAAGNSAALLPGMIISNEPGYYKPGEYGMRFENLMVVKECGTVADMGTPLLEFETLTLAPIDRTLLDLDLLTGEEEAWVDSYHGQVFGALADVLEQPDREWLAQETRGLRAASAA